MSLCRGFFAAAIILAASPSQACEDLRMESCRLSFTERNLPVPSQPVDGTPKHRELLESLEAAKSAMKIADGLRTQRTALQDQLTKLDDDAPAAGNLWGAGTAWNRRRANQALAALEQRLLEAERREKAAFNRVIDRTETAYGLTPRTTTAPPYPTLQAGAITPHPWAPYFSRGQALDPLGREYMLSSDELVARARSLGAAEGSRISVDGGTNKATAGVRIFPPPFIRALQGTPPRHGIIASIIYHEAGHWLDAAARSRYPTPLESFQSEERAYRRQASQANVFGLTAAEVKELNDAADAYRDLAVKAGTLSWGELKERYPGLEYALSIDPGIAAEADEAARIEAERSFAQHLAAPLASAGPTAPPAASQTTMPLLVAPRASERSPLLAPRRTVDQEVLSMVEAACRGDWAQATYGLRGFSQMTALHALALERVAAEKSLGCEQALIYRLVAMHRNGDRLDLARLQAEAASIAAVPTHEGIPLENENPGPVQPRGGFTPGDRPTQRQLEGWRR
jgi:hypothetical protein